MVIEKKLSQSARVEFLDARSPVNAGHLNIDLRILNLSQSAVALKCMGL
jgi:hypothetical protein